MVIKTDNIHTLTLHNIDPDHIGFAIYPLKIGHKQMQKFHSPNRRTFCTIIYLTCGQIGVHIDRCVCHLGRQQVISLHPSTVMSLSMEDGHTEGWMIHFEENFFTRRYTDHALYQFSFFKEQRTSPYDIGLEEVAGWPIILETMHREYLNRRPDANNILRSYLNIIMGTISRQIHSRPQELPRSEKEEKIIAFERLLGEYYRTQRFPSYYADQLFISSNYLNRLCKERRGVSAGQMIRQRVLLEAERLLIHTYKNISEVSFLLGFDNVSYFITFFKKKYGVSPDEFRKLQ